MFKKVTYYSIGVACLSLTIWACAPQITQKTASKNVPANYNSLQDTARSANGNTSTDTTNTADIDWKKYFTDPDLIALIDTALSRNQEFNIMLYEINIAQAEVRARKGAILPKVDIGVNAGAEKSGQYTRNGAVDNSLNIQPGKPIPNVLPDYGFGASLSWEVDIWKKLRNAKQAAVYRYLATIQGRNFMRTSIVAEIASTYYELLAFDNQLSILKQNIVIQNNALKTVRMEKVNAKVTELAVRRFEAQVYHTQSMQFLILQKIVEAENKLNFLIGSYPKHIKRNSDGFINIKQDSIYTGVPSQLLQRRWDIQKAESQLKASKLDVKVAKANFYPTFRITGGLGYEAFNPKLIISSP
ncbi:MAG TPA: TolC family protein, partial [Cytophaga sp.]|nr:TolC family protein [Cytophaga sp.]